VFHDCEVISRSGQRVEGRISGTRGARAKFRLLPAANVGSLRVSTSTGNETKILTICKAHPLPDSVDRLRPPTMKQADDS
jgi:hypothetical protein